MIKITIIIKKFSPNMNNSKIIIILFLVSLVVIAGCTNFAEPELEGNGNGSEGPNYYSGKGPPPRNLGYEGDMYMDTNNGNIYERMSGNWIYIGNINDHPNLQDNFGN